MPMDVLRILNSSPNTSGGQVIRAKVDDLRKAEKQLNDPNQQLYATGSELQASGLAGEFSRLQGNLTRIEGYNISISSSKDRLNREAAFLDQIRAIVAKFSESDGEDPNNSVKTRADYANEALASI